MQEMTKLYLTALSDLKRVEVDYTPKSISPSRKAGYSDIKVVGRNNPIHHYTSGDNELQLELDFYAKEQSREDVIRKCRLIESWAMNDGFDKKPETIRITFGRLFKYETLWIITGVVTDLSNFDDAYGMLPKQAYVKVSFKLDTKTNRKRKDVLW